MTGCWDGERKDLEYAQLEDGKIREAVVLLTPDLMVQVVLEYVDI